MLSINTNLSSLITQSSLKTSTLGLNQAIERMSTGFKINHAKDNAAGYSISTSMSTKISAYQVAENNAAMGLNMVNTASSTLATMENSLSRARALCIQAQNGTYGSQSIDAIKSELNAIVDELIRTKESTEFNGINLFGKEGMPVANPETGFIADVVVQNPEITVSDPTKLLDAIENNTIIGISNAETLAELATIVNNDLHHCEGKTIVLTNDIDLSGYSNWTPIGWCDSADLEHHVFKGDFNGNGHTISNLTITSTSHKGVGLFGYIKDGTCSNIELTNISINSQNDYTGGLVGASDGSIVNSFASGEVTSSGNRTGGLVGQVYTISFSYSSVIVNGSDVAGSLAGRVQNNVSNSYATGNVSSVSNCGGLVGDFWGKANNCYATGDISSKYAATGSAGHSVGGLFGSGNGTIDGCYATGNVAGGKNATGGLVGGTWSFDGCSIKNSYATGSVTGYNNVGGLYGKSHNGGEISSTNSYWNIETTGQATSLLGEGVTTGELNTLISEGRLPSTGNEVKGANTSLQIGVNGDVNSSITVDFGLTSTQISVLKNNPTSSYSLAVIDNLLSMISEKQVGFGAAQNRLESALEEISIQYENLVSSLSTIRDADIAEESSRYIKMQILQQASATLMATANQSPSIALQLI